MKITGIESIEIILREIAGRIKSRRVSMDITQADLAKQCGVSLSTLVRIESGEDSKISNYIKIISTLGLSDNIDIFIPEIQPDFKSLFENKPIKQRARPNNNKQPSEWVWGEDRKE